MTLEERLLLAKNYRKKGYNCAQCVLASFPEITDMKDSQSLGIAIGLGGGCGCGEICGVLSSMALLEGMRIGGAPSDKAEVYGNMKKLHSEFTCRFGTAQCCELKSPGKAVSCNDLIWSGVEMYHNHVEATGR